MDLDNDEKGWHHSGMCSQPMTYEILVQGQLDSSWSDWFNGLQVIPQENGFTMITGPIQDQAALQGILMKVFNLGLKLLSVRGIHPGSYP